MKKKYIIILLILAFCIGLIISSVIINKTKSENIESQMKTSNVDDEKISDECTDEYEAMQLEQIQETTSSEVKISPNCELVLNKFYLQCEHTISENVELPQELINMTEDDLQAYFDDWEVFEFSSNKVVLYKTFEGQCNEHYLLKNIDGRIVVFKVKDNGETELYQQTDISTEYLPETDLINMQNGGLEIFTTQELNKVIEDFE